MDMQRLIRCPASLAPPALGLPILVALDLPSGAADIVFVKGIVVIHKERGRAEALPLTHHSSSGVVEPLLAAGLSSFSESSPVLAPLK